MCVGCYALYVMTLVSPVGEAPQAVTVPDLNQSAIQTQVQKKFTPAEVRASVDSVLQGLPTTPDAKPLRDAFSQMKAQLAGVNDQEMVYAIVNQQMLSLSEQVDSASNSQELLQILEELGIEQYQPQASLSLNSPGLQWGWLA